MENKTELSYIDLVSKLHEDVMSDEGMSEKDKKQILRLIEQLEDKIEKYSY